MDFNQLREDTLKKENIIYTKGFHRFVNHEARTLSVGFKFKRSLWAERDKLRFDEGSFYQDQERYAQVFDKFLLQMFQVVKIDQSTGKVVRNVANPHRSELIANSIAENCNRYAEQGYCYDVQPVPMKVEECTTLTSR